MLEHHSDPGAHRIDVDARVGDVGPGQEDLAVVDPFQQVRGAQQCRLARPRCTQQHHHLVAADAQVEAAQHHVAAEPFDHPLHLQHRSGVVVGPGWFQPGHQTVPPVCSRSRSRAVYQSESRMNGQLKATNNRPATT